MQKCEISHNSSLLLISSHCIEDVKLIEDLIRANSNKHRQKSHKTLVFQDRKTVLNERSATRSDSNNAQCKYSQIGLQCLHLQHHYQATSLLLYADCVKCNIIILIFLLMK